MEEQFKKQLFTVVIYAEHCVGLMNQVLIIFTRRCLNLEDVSASPTSMEGIHRLTLTTYSDLETMQKVVKQIEKRIDVLKAFLYTNEDIIYQEIALYKIDTNTILKVGGVEDLIRKHSARILDMTPDYTVIEKAGHGKETKALLDELRSYGVKQFVRSGRICVTKSPIEKLDLYLQEQQLRKERLLGRDGI